MERYLPLLALLVGSSMGGVALGIAMAILSIGLALVPALREGVIIAIPTLSAAATFSPRLLRALPDRTRQLKESLVLESSRSRAALTWGLDLGSAVRTLAVTPLTYGFLAVAAAQPTPQMSFTLAVLYGTSRGMLVVFSSLRRSVPPNASLPTMANRLRSVAISVTALAVATLTLMGEPR